MSEPDHAPSVVVEYVNPRGAGQPLNSRFVIERHADGVSFEMLPEGLDRAALTLTVLAVIIAASLAFAALVEFRILPRPRGGSAQDAWALAALCAAPLALLWIMVFRAARRPTVIHARGGHVTLFSGAALFSPIETWPTTDVASIDAKGRSMRLTLRDGREALLIAGHDRADLQWAARELREALGLPLETGESDIERSTIGAVPYGTSAHRHVESRV